MTYRAVPVIIATAQQLLPEDYIVGTGGHEEQQRHGQEEIRSRGQERLARQGGSVRGRRAGQRAANYLLVVGPDDAPHVEQHHDAKATAHANRKNVVVVLPDGRVVHEEPSRGYADDGSDSAKNISAGSHFLNHHEENEPDHDPKQQEEPDRGPGAAAFEVCIGADEGLSPIPEADEDRDQRAPAEPVQRGQGQVLKNLGFHGGVHLLHEGDIDEVKEIEQADSCDPGEEVKPPQNKLGRFLARMLWRHKGGYHGYEMVHRIFSANFELKVVGPPNA